MTKEKLTEVSFESFEALYADKVAELTASINRLKTDDNISKNTRGTQLYAKKRERATLQLLATAHRQAKVLKLTEDEQNRLVSLTTLTAERPSMIKIEVNAGDSVLQLLQKYDGVKNPWDKIMKAAAKAELTYDAATGMFN